MNFNTNQNIIKKMNRKSRIPEIQGGCQWKKLPGEWRLRRRRRQ